MKPRSSYSCGEGDTPLLGETIGDALDRAAARWPDHEALVVRHQARRLSYRDLRAAAERCARALVALGLERGDRLAICSPNNAEWAIVQYATAKIGAILRALMEAP